VTLIRKEIREFESRDRAGRLLYPGKWDRHLDQDPASALDVRRHGAGGAGARLGRVLRLL